MKHGFRYIHSCNYQFKRKLFWTIEKNLCSKVTVAPNKRTPLEQMHAKFVDDMILAVSLKLKETLTEDPNPVHPLSGAAADALRKVSQKSKTGPGLKKTLPKPGTPEEGGPAAPNSSKPKKVWYNWKKSNL